MDYDDTDYAVSTTEAPDGTPESDQSLVKDIIARIRSDRQHHQKSFRRMRRDMQIAMWGAEKERSADLYRANISGRHVRQRTAALYAKNPRVQARRREQIDFKIWDETPQSLELALQTIQAQQMAVMQAQAAGPQIDPLTGAALPAIPQDVPGFAQAQAVLKDFQEGTLRKQMMNKLGKTLEILFTNAMSEQKPLNFKTAMKQVVRRALTTGVGYVKLGFQRETGIRPETEAALADSKARIDHLERLRADLAEGEFDEYEAEYAELMHGMATLQSEPEIIVREGLVFSYPQSTRVIPDKLCQSLTGFVGARHMTVEYLYTVDEVQERFGVKLEKGKYTSYTTSPGSARSVGEDDLFDDEYTFTDKTAKEGGLVCVWEHFDKSSGNAYYVADGYGGWLKPPAAPDVFVEDFWPLYALTFNAVESEDELFPPSDVALMLDMQRDHNNARQGKREHRRAARPRWVAAAGAFGGDEDLMALQNLGPFQMRTLNMDPQQRIQDIMQVVPVPGVDPNLYDTGEIFSDIQVVVGAQEAQFGGLSQATATEASISASSTASSDTSSIDDLDEFLTTVARGSGQILQREMSEEQVMRICGPGAVWPQMTLSEIAGELGLEVAAGSTGKPNQAVEVRNMQQLGPLLMQLPGISPEWLAKETVRRLDDRLDITEATTSGMPSIMAMNALAQAQPTAPTANPADEPAAQGAEGQSNAPAPPAGSGGSDPAFGSNQISGTSDVFA